MSKLSIVVDDLKVWQAYYPSEDVISVKQYLQTLPPDDAPGKGNPHVINLCGSYRYLSEGYYCSLLAEARGEKVIPSVKTINDLARKSLYSLDLNLSKDDLEEWFEGVTGNELDVLVCFGYTHLEQFSSFGRRLFDVYPCPVLVAQFERNASGIWTIETIKPRSLEKLVDKQQDFFAASLDRFSSRIWRKPRERKSYAWDLAILVNPEEKLPPSCPKALKLFEKSARRMGVSVDFITKKDYQRIGEYDGLFIRETTAISDHTYRFAKKAETEGLVVIDDPQSILRCTNKVFMSETLRKKGIPMPRYRFIYRNDKQQYTLLAQELGFPMVLKIPDGSFSRGVIKVENMDALQKAAEDMLKNSAVLLAQEFMFTDYDWRIGILNKKPLFACQYFMSKGHWQIYNHSSTGTKSGRFKTMPVQEAPLQVVNIALKAANQIGDGLYGVDLKQSGDKVVVIEVNDNPNIDHKVEDLALGVRLYDAVINEFIMRFEQRLRR